MFIIPKDWYVVKKTKKMGRGVIATHDIPPGTVIGDYLGKIMREKDENEARDGLYTMIGGARYDILARPKDHGIHLINHSCIPNCAIYPYKGRMLYVATRYIFAGEEITVTYMLGRAAEDEKGLPCELHACHCGSRVCTGSMHDNEFDYEKWHALRERSFGSHYNKLPGNYGTQLLPLDTYPASVNIAAMPYRYNVFGSEIKSTGKYNEASLPALAILRKRIQETGRRLSFPKMHFTIYGIRDQMLLAEPK
jgi:hypothetical protein